MLADGIDLVTRVVFQVDNPTYTEVDKICRSLQTSLGIKIWRYYSAFGFHSCQAICTQRQFLIVSLTFGNIVQVQQREHPPK